MRYRAERAGDAPAIRTMVGRIMRPQTADLVDRIRGSDRYVQGLTRVATEEDEIVGFVMLSRLEVLGPVTWSALALAPLAVMESHQGTGIGTRLTQDAVGHADTLGEAVVIVLGHPNFYSRLGFVPAEDMGIDPPQGTNVSGDAWMARALTQYRAAMRGTASYASDFIETGSIPGL